MSPTPAAPKGGQKSPSKPEPIVVDGSKLSPADLEALRNSQPGEVVFVPGDRIPTPDGLNVGEVMKATAQAEREKQLAIAQRGRHMGDCLEHRTQECNCPANLHQLPKALETVKVGTTEWIRVDEAHEVTVKVPDPTQHRGPLVNKQVLVLPRWICTTCGLAMRVIKPGGHACDEAYLVWKAKPIPLSLSVPASKRFTGAYRVTLWRDAEGRYHLGEQVVEAGMVVAENELLIEGYFPALEGAVSDLLLSEFTP